MFKTIRKAAQDSLIYGLGEVTTRLVAFLLIPLYTRFLTPEDYGVIGVVLVLLPLLASAVNMGIISAFYRFYFISYDAQDEEVVISTAFFFNVLSSACFLSLFVLLAPNVSLLFTGDASYSLYFQMGMVSLFFSNLKAFGLAILRVQRRTWFYVVSVVSSFILNLILNIYLVAILRLGVMGIILGQLVSQISVTIVMVPLVIIKEVNLCWSFRVLKGMLSFGIPLIPINLAAWVIRSAPVPLLARLSSLTESGLYSMGYKFGSIISLLIVAPFQLGWGPIAYSIAENQDARPTYARVLTYFSFVAIFLSLGVSVLARDVLRLIATPEFYAAYEPVFLLAIGFVFYGVVVNFSFIINIIKKTYFSSALWTIAAITNLGLSYLLIPMMGKIGAAIASVLAYLIIVILGYIVVQKFFPLQYEISRLAKVFGAGIALYLISLLVKLESVWASLAFNLALACSYPFVLYCLGFYTREEWNKAFSIISKFRRDVLHIVKRSDAEAHISASPSSRSPGD